MTDTRERDPLADAFSRFRTEAPSEIVPPGAAAAQHAVTLRRWSRLATVAGLTAAGLTGIGYAAANLAAGGAPADPAATAGATVGPTRGPAELQRLGEEALARLGGEPGNSRPGVVFGPLDAAGAGFRYGLGTAGQPLPAGEYTLRAACLGGGGVTVSWSAGGRAQSTGLTCDGTVRAADFALAVPGTVTLRFVPDDTATGRAGVAVAVTDPREVRARTALGATGDGLLAAGSGFADADRREVAETRHGPGRFRLEVACAGAGTLKATLSLGDASQTGTVTCADDPEVVRIPLTSDRETGSMTVLLEPDADAVDEAGYAYRVRQG